MILPALVPYGKYALSRADMHTNEMNEQRLPLISDDRLSPPRPVFRERAGVRVLLRVFPPAGNKMQCRSSNWARAGPVPFAFLKMLEFFDAIFLSAALVWILNRSKWTHG